MAALQLIVVISLSTNGHILFWFGKSSLQSAACKTHCHLLGDKSQ
jgi:hypothetical protein